MKNLTVFALMIFGAVVADANIYLAMLCIMVGLGVYFLAPKKTSHSH